MPESHAISRRQLLSATGLSAAGWALGGAAATARAQESAPSKAIYNPLAAGYDDQSGQYVLPALRYAHNALEPVIDGQTMQLHHEKHHAGYVNNLNAALKKLAAAREAGDYSAVQALSRAIAFNGGGHTLHTLFWNNMAPVGAGGKPSSALQQAIDRDFGSLEAFRSHFSAAAIGVEGGGWAILGLDRVARRLLVVQGENQQKLTTWGLVPLLVLDVWEHAYYLKYQNRRAEYVQAWWQIVNWNEVSQRFDVAAAP